MRRLYVAALADAAAVVVEIAFPGNPLYHAGWYNVLIAALTIVTFVAGRREFRRARFGRARVAIALVVCGAAIVGACGVASGLFAPDNQTIVGAPGQRVRVETLGTIVFPLATFAGAPVALERPLHASIDIGLRWRPAGNFIVRTQMRSVVYVEARDLNGNRLTITQPEGSSFLSPVLLMQQRQSIAGLDLPFDSFNVPAARRVVKAVMFTPQQAAMLLHGNAQSAQPAVLFAVDDQNDRPLTHGIALSAGGKAAKADGLVLRGRVVSYPAIDVVAVPNILATGFGMLLLIGGALAMAYH